MNLRRNKLIREQMEAKLRRLKPLGNIEPPRHGWIRAIREALGMTGSQLARRLGVTRQRISRIEQDEVSGKVTLETMHKTAEALDCEFVYALIPRFDLTAIITRQVEKLARARLERASATMRLEAQELTPREKRKALEDEVEAILSESTRLWWEDDAL